MLRLKPVTELAEFPECPQGSTGALSAQPDERLPL